MKRNIIFFWAGILMLVGYSDTAVSQDTGEGLFKQYCSACHTVGKGRLVGPDLAGIDKRQPDEWISEFIRSSQTVIKSGDAYADSLFKAYNQVMMPDQPNLTDEQIKSIIAHLKAGTPAAVASSTTATSAPPSLTGDAVRGQNLFTGNIRFAKNGPSCNSCHNVNMEGLITGGALAKDLTQSVTRLTAAGVQGVITGMPFPQMQQSYASKPLSEQEVADITAFLVRADEIASTQVMASIGNKMLLGGISGVVVLLILFSFLWMRRKQRTVNYAIYERQIKST